MKTFWPFGDTGHFLIHPLVRQQNLGFCFESSFPTIVSIAIAEKASFAFQIIAELRKNWGFKLY